MIGEYEYSEEGEMEPLITDSLPIELMEKILMPLSVEDILNFCHVSQHEVHKSRQFWMSKLDYDFGSISVLPSRFVDTGSGDGLKIYRVFANGFWLGIEMSLKRGHLDVAKWLFAMGCRLDMKIYRELELAFQLDEVDWLLSSGLYDDDNEEFKAMISAAYRRSHTGFIRLILKHCIKLELPKSDMVYFTTNGMDQPRYNHRLIDIDIFELLIQNGIFPISYLGVISHPEYMSMLERNGIFPYDTLSITSDMCDDLDLLNTILEHNILPDLQFILSIMKFNDTRFLRILILISKFIPIKDNSDLHQSIIARSIDQNILDVTDWYIQQGFIPSTQNTDKVLTQLVKNMYRKGTLYRIFEYLLHHGIYPSTVTVDALIPKKKSQHHQKEDEYTNCFNNKEKILFILSEYEIYPSVMIP